MKTTIIIPHDHVAGLGRSVVALPTPATIDRAAAWHIERAIRSYDRRETSPEQLTARSLVRQLCHLVDVAHV